MDKRWKEDCKKLPARPVVSYQGKTKEMMHPAYALLMLDDYIKKAGLEDELGYLLNQFESLYESIGGTIEGLVQMASIFTLGMELIIKFEALGTQAEKAKSKMAGSYSRFDEILPTINKRIWRGLELNEKRGTTFKAVRALPEVISFEKNEKEKLRKKAELEGNMKWDGDARKEKIKWQYQKTTFIEHRKRIQVVFKSKKKSLRSSPI